VGEQNFEKRGKSEMVSISKDEANDDEIDETQFEVNMSLKT